MYKLEVLSSITLNIYSIMLFFCINAALHPQLSVPINLNILQINQICILLDDCHVCGVNTLVLLLFLLSPFPLLGLVLDLMRGCQTEDETLSINSLGIPLEGALCLFDCVSWQKCSATDCDFCDLCLNRVLLATFDTV